MAGCCSCHVYIVGMNRPVATGATTVHLCSLNVQQLSGGNSATGFGFGLRNCRFLDRRRLRFVVSAELSKPYSLNIGLDSKLPWVGPVPGDIAEVEAYCRIFRAAERLHSSLMDTLCNPVTGECTVSYNFPSEDRPLLEDKIVSVLGCMVCLLNKGKEDVLSGRSAILNTFRDVDANVREDKLPPLTLFRGEMKRYCESLHVALENYLTRDDDRSLNVWRKLQRLKSVCYDAGFPRGDDDPSHSLFANWSPVYLSTSKEEIEVADSEVAFWRGSQVTEEGLKWLIEKGFKTIVDIRAESIKDEFYETELNGAVLDGRVELVKLPVEDGTAPSMEQVEQFAALVSNPSKKPIYLHSREGVWRNSAMVSRWRQYMTRYASQFVPNHTTTNTDIQSQDAGELEEPSNESSNGTCSSEGAVSSINEATGKTTINNNGAYVEDVSSQIPTSTQSVNKEEIRSLTNINSEINPLKSQLPPSNIFSRKEMSRFLKSKNVSPPTYLHYQQKKLKTSGPPGEHSDETFPKGEIMRTGNTNGSASSDNVAPKRQGPQISNGTYVSNKISPSTGPSLTISGKGVKNPVSSKADLIDSKNELDKTAIPFIDDKRSNGQSTLHSVDDDLGIIEGNMCASTTGVVRVQSRKKAEMFLVRTDGFSCAREKVTESSLAFTHPSTQQQMLMWKSTPKTVLLLKKLGSELMEEAKQVASYLHHQERMNVLVEPDVHDIFARTPGFGFVQTFYSQDTSDLHERVDFVACLGGDGVILHASNLFRGAVPPVVSFNLGSLGFLTSHNFEDYRQDLRQVIHGNDTVDGVYITLRLRIRCEIFRHGKAVPGKVFDVLNEVVIDRGSNPYLSKIECYEHDRLITKVQGDGVIVATPTGSTAYSTAAGGSMGILDLTKLINEEKAYKHEKNEVFAKRPKRKTFN